MSFKVIPIDVLNNTSLTYNQNLTSLIGKITTKTISGRTVIGPPIVKYRNTVTSPEAIVPNDVVVTDNNRVFVITTETGGLFNVALYDLNPNTSNLTYVGKILLTVLDSPSTTHTVRGLKVLDTGTTGWKILILTTANQAANSGLYMANDIALSDFAFVPTTIPTANAGGQKAVYKLDDSPFTLSNGAGLMLDVPNSRIYVHRGVAATHNYMAFDLMGTITTVTAGGRTTDLFLAETGNLPALSGTLLQTNSEEYTVPTSGPNAGFPCVVFHTSTTMYRGRLSDLTAAAVIWPSLEFANNLDGINTTVALTTIRATYSDVLQKVVLLTDGGDVTSLMVKDFANDTSDLRTTLMTDNNNEATAKEMYKFKNSVVPIGFDTKNGSLVIVSSTTGQRGIYSANYDVDDLYNLTHIISPVIDVPNDRLLRFTVGFVRPDLASPIKIYYRTSGFGVATGGWVAVPDDMDLNGLVSPTGQIQFKIGYKVFSNDSTNGLQIYSAGIIAESNNSISDNWEYSHDDSSPGNPSIAAFRLKKTYSSSVPQLFFRAYDLSNNLYVQSDTTNNAGLFEYSTDGGVNWLPLGVISNTVGTLIRYTFAVPPGIDVRPSLRES